MSVPDGYKATEVGVIPEDWEAKPLSSLKPFITSGSRGWAKYYAETGDAFVRITNLSRQNIYPDLADLRCVKLPEGENEGTRTGLRNGDVLVSITADIGIIGFVDDRVPKPAYINQHIATVRVDQSEANSKFLSYFLATEGSQRRVRATTDAGAKAGMSLTGVGNLLAAFPPTVTEQTAIAEALSDVDEAIAAQEAVIAKKRALKTATMQALLSGTRRLPGFSAEWEIKSLAQIGKPLIGLTYSPRDVRETGTLVLRSSNVQSGILAFDDNVFVEPSKAQRCLVEENDILICVRNGSRDLIGKCAKIDRRGKGMAFGAFMSIFRTPDHGYVFHYFQSEAMRRQINEHLGATINQITNASLNGFKVAWPSESKEREGIAEVLSDIDHEIVATTSELSKLRHLKAGMIQQLLTGKIRLV